MKKFVVMLIFLLIMPVVLAQQGHMKLLAAQEINGTYVGGTADLFFELKPGSSRVFLETFPLTKMDTQISTRSAKEIACNYFDLGCKNYDFIYTIKSRTSIIGGPSAGAAIAALTTATIKGLEINNQIAVTGTINSGGIIGPVGALKEKILAAPRENISIVLIPAGTRFYKDESNMTLDLKSFGQKFGVTVIEVADLNELVFLLTGEKLRSENFTLIENQEYVEVMKYLSDLLCSRGEEIKILLEDYELGADEKEEIENQTIKAEQAEAEGKYYSSASYCFGMNTKLRKMLYEKEELSSGDKERIAAEIEKEINEFKKTVKGKELKTITDLQAYGVVMERLNEGEFRLKEFEKSKEEADLAMAQERVYSAQSWFEFFKMSGKVFKLDQKSLEDSCLEKIQEAKERYQYVNLFIPWDFGLSEGIKEAENSYGENDYVSCLIKASQAKAEADTVLSSLGVDEENLGELLDNKLKTVEGSLSRTIEKGAFPILGYSYYQYAQSLRDEPAVALVYAEYALELGNLDMYFEEEQKSWELRITPEIWTFIFGAIFGAAVVGLIFVLFKKKKTLKRKKRG